MQRKKSANWKSSTQKKSSGHDQTMTSELAVAIVCLNAELKKGQFLNLFSVDKSNLCTMATYEERELHWCCFTHHLLAGRSNKNCKQLTESALASGTYMGWNWARPSIQHTPQGKSHRVKTSSRGIFSKSLKHWAQPALRAPKQYSWRKAGVGSEQTRLSQGPAGQQQTQAPWSSRVKALRDAAKVTETRGDLPSNCWPHKFLYSTDLFLHSH